MTRTSRWLMLSIAGLMVIAVSGSPSFAADRSKVDQATRRVQQGAHQIGQGHVGSGFKQMFTGIGHTIVEGAKYSGRTIGEAFSR